MSLGDFDEARREQILTLEYVTEGSSLREVLRCPVGQPELRYVGGRRLELRVLAVPDPVSDSEPDSDPTRPADAPPEEEESRLWVIPDAPS